MQYHQIKLKKIICNSQYQIDKIKNQYNIPSEYFSIYYNNVCFNNINTEITNNIEKIDYRFIYSGDIYKGLENVLEMLPKIKEIFPKTTLYIYTTV